MDEFHEFEPPSPGGRRVARPSTVESCAQCGAALGANYAGCRACFDAVERYWLADWQALLDREGITPGSPEEQLLAQVVLDEFGRHPWTVLDIAMSLLRCTTCGAELGEAYAACGECGRAFGSSIAAEFGATANEHALHVGRWVLRYPQRHSANAVAAWRITLPRILTGWLPSTQDAQRGMALIKAGRAGELEAQLSAKDIKIFDRSKRSV